MQKRLLEFFVTEVTARSAADLLNIQPNTTALFYNKIRLVIAHHLSLQTDEIFDGQIGLAIYLSGQKRKKGEWAKTRKKRNMQNAVDSVAGGVGIITAISLFLCRKNDFSFPPKFRKAELQTETTPETTQDDI